MQPNRYSVSASSGKWMMPKKEKSAGAVTTGTRNSAIHSNKGLEGMLSSNKLSLGLQPAVVPEGQGLDLVSQGVPQLLKTSQQSRAEMHDPQRDRTGRRCCEGQTNHPINGR